MPIRHAHHVPRAPTGFTLVELLVAGVVTAFVLSAVTMSLSQLGRAKNTSKLRYDAFMRADAALNILRRDLVSVLRSDDLFYTRFMLTDDSVRMHDEIFDRDEVLVFNTRVKPLRNIDFNGEGFEYESHYRVGEDDQGTVLWSRHDPMPDEYPQGGGIATPEVEGIVSLTIEAYDGNTWYDQWDSDNDGLPLAVRLTVVASGNRSHEDVYTAPRAVLRTVVSIDRVLSPNDLFKVPDEEEQANPEDGAGGVDENGNPIPGGSGGQTGGGTVTIPGGGPNGGAGGGRPGGGRPGGGRPGVGRPGGGGPRPGTGGPKPGTGGGTGTTRT